MGWKLQSLGRNVDLNAGACGESQCTVNYSTQFLFTHGFSQSHFHRIPFLQELLGGFVLVLVFFIALPSLLIQRQMPTHLFVCCVQ